MRSCCIIFFFSSRRRHTRSKRDWSSDVCSSDLDHPAELGAVGATGTLAANRIASDADVVIGVGTRWSDFTTASKTAFRNPDVRFVNVNVAELDALKQGGIALVG